MRGSAFASSRAVCLVVVLWLTILSLLAPPALAQVAVPEPGIPGGSGTPLSTPLSFSPLPDVYHTSPRYTAEAVAGRFTFDRTGYTLVVGGSTSSALSEAIGPELLSGTVKMQFEGLTHAMLVPERLLNGVVNEFSGPDSRGWRADALTYGALTYRQLYNGIDLRLEGLPGRFKGTYYVAPGADPGSIRWRFTGATSVEISRETGELWVELPAHPASYLIEGAPLVWQEAGTRKVIVPASYQMDAEGVISYALGSYDPTRPLVIDPVVSVLGPHE
jgi:hypothetical protein